MALQPNKYAYQGTPQAVDVTLTSLANGGFAHSAAISNAAGYKDFLLRVKTKGGNAGSNAGVRVFLAAALSTGDFADGRTGANSSGGTVRDSFFVGAVAISGTEARVGIISLAASLGGVIPPRFVLTFVNSTGFALSSTAGDHSVDIEGVYETIET
jgi:hypothetical protein